LRSEIIQFCKLPSFQRSKAVRPSLPFPSSDVFYLQKNFYVVTLPTMTILFFTLAFLLCTPSFGRTLDPILHSGSNNSTNSTTNLLSPGNIPNPFIWDPDLGHKLFFDRKPLDHRHQSNPGVSQKNWRAAVVEAALKAVAMQQQAHVETGAIVADNRFLYENTLALSSHGTL